MTDSGYWLRRITRRRVIAGAGVTGLGIAGGALIGCSGSNKSSNSGSTSNSSSGAATSAAGGFAQPGVSTATRLQTPSSTVDPSKINKNGTLNVRQNNPLATINPYKGLDSVAATAYAVFDHLIFTRSDTGETVPMLASSFETPDPQTFIFKLKPAVFHNKPPVSGRAVKASDVVATFKAAKASKQLTASVWWRNTLDTVSAVDDQTVTLTTSAVDAWTTSTTNLASPLTSIILPQEVAANIDVMDNDLIGSGPYQFVSHENGTNLKFKRFDSWRVKGEPWLAGINGKLLNQQSSAIAAFAAQQIDGIGFANKLERDTTVQQLGNKVTSFTEPTSLNWIVGFKGNKAFADPRVRQAMYHAIYRDEFIQLMYFGDAIKTCHVPPVFKSYSLDATELKDTLWKFDPATGRQLLQAAGFDTSKTYNLKYNAAGDIQNQMAQIAQSQLQKNLGLKINLVTQDLATWLTQTAQTGDYDFVTYQTLQYADPSSYLLEVQKNNGRNPDPTGLLDDELDGMLANQKTILDEGKRQDAIKAMQRSMIGKWVPWLPVISPLSNTGIWNYYHIGDLGNDGLRNFSGQTYVDPH